MKKKKTFCLLAACLVMTTAVVNVRLATVRQGKAVSELVQGNVQAKAFPLALPVILLLMSCENNSGQDIYYEYLEKDTSCPTIEVSNGTFLYGSSEGMNLLASLNANLSVPKQIIEGNLDTNVSYRAELNKNDAYSFKFNISLVFKGDDWTFGICKVTDKSSPQAVKNCKNYDMCSELAKMRGDAFKQALGLS